jgi:hypothetical protein
MTASGPSVSIPMARAALRVRRGDGRHESVETLPWGSLEGADVVVEPLTDDRSVFAFALGPAVAQLEFDVAFGADVVLGEAGVDEVVEQGHAVKLVDG